MRIGMITDIHIDINVDSDIETNLYQVIEEKKIDCLIIGGDVSNHYHTTINTVNRIKKNAGIEVYFVPGNHDMWDEKGEFSDSFTIYKKYEEHPFCLSSGAKILNDQWVVIGDVGWYDYSFGDSRYTLQEFEKMHAFERTWKDSEFVRWNKSNQEINEFFLQKLTTEMNKHKDKNLILVTHMVSKNEFTVNDGREIWKYFNAFLGSKQLGRLFEESKVKYALMGHVHFRADKKLNGVHYICPCLGYSTEWKSDPVNCLEEIRNSMFLVEI